MPMSERLTITVSTKGRIMLPKVIRRALRWEAGMRLIVENTPEGVLLRPEPAFEETRPRTCLGPSSVTASPDLWRRWMRGFWRKRRGAMRAVDTNIVVRYLTGDDPGQAAKAKAVIDAGDVFVSRSVLLESVWCASARPIIRLREEAAGLAGYVKP